MVIKFKVDVDTDVPPEKVLAALTDFSAKRLKLWPQLSPKHFKAHSVGATSADVTEGSDKPISVWAREDYDWSTPGVVRWTAKESNFSLPGHAMEFRVQSQGKGSHVTLLYDRGVYGLKGNVAGVMMKLFGKQVMTKYYNDTFTSWQTDKDSAK